MQDYIPLIEESIEIMHNKQVASDVFLMGLKSPSMSKAAKPGQFVMVRVGKGIDPLLRRPFSICGVLDRELVLILYRVVGRGTGLMAEMGPGKRLSVLGPLGNGFKLPKKDSTPILVAGGMGIAPLFFLSWFLKGRDSEFMAGFSSSDEVIPDDLIGDTGIKLSISTDDGSKGHHGMVTDLLNEYIRINHEFTDKLSIFTCGPLPMLKAVTAIAGQKKIECSVSLESDMACGLGACQGCAVQASSMEKREYFHVCKDGPVFPAEAIDWNSI